MSGVKKTGRKPKTKKDETELVAQQECKQEMNEMNTSQENEGQIVKDWSSEAVKQESPCAETTKSCIDFDRIEVNKLGQMKVDEVNIEDIIKCLIVRGEKERKSVV